MSDVIIDKNIAMPKGGRRSKYPWREMEVGDSFFLPKATVSMGAANDRYAPTKFIMRKVDGGHRVWRIE